MSKPNNIGSIQKEITFADTTSTSLGFLPPNAYPTTVRVLVTTAFDDTGTDLVDIGVNGTADNLADDVDVSSAGVATVTSTTSWGVIQSSSDPTEVTAIYIGANTDATAGACKVVVEYTFNE